MIAHLLGILLLTNTGQMKAGMHCALYPAWTGEEVCRVWTPTTGFFAVYDDAGPGDEGKGTVP